MSNTVVGLFPSTAAAENVRQQLVSSGYDSGNIRIVANDHSEHYGAGENAGIGEKVSHFFKSLTGGDDDAHRHYASGVNGGGALLTVKTDGEDASGIAALLRENGARDIEGDNNRGDLDNQGDLDAADYNAAPLNTGRAALDGEQAIPVIEEDLVVGKREVDRGGVRVYSHVVQTPVSTDVTLRDENILVERRAVDRPATAEDFVSGRSYELRASGEEAVVGKTARVVEEVLVGKDTTQHTEAIHDSVRRTEVEVEELPGSGLRTETTKGY